MEDVLHVRGQMTLNWCWRRRRHISPPTCPKHGGKDGPTGLLGEQGSLPSIPPCSGAASPARDMILERPWESCHFCRKVKAGSLNPKWGELKYPVHRLKISHYWRKQGTTLQQPYFHWPTVLGWGIDLPAHPPPP